jgi:hypothetical protein
VTGDAEYRVASIDGRGVRDVFHTGNRALAEAWAAMRADERPAALAFAYEARGNSFECPGRRQRMGESSG